MYIEHTKYIYIYISVHFLARYCGILRSASPHKSATSWWWSHIACWLEIQIEGLVASVVMDGQHHRGHWSISGEAYTPEVSKPSLCDDTCGSESWCECTSSGATIIVLYQWIFHEDAVAIWLPDLASHCWTFGWEINSSWNNLFGDWHRGHCCEEHAEEAKSYFWCVLASSNNLG